tara:strand:+ start:7041 stop:8312 length:1272 start_codon:yes stop_codon:yes gene_type:complete
MFKNLNNNFFNKEIVILFFLYLTLLISFFLGENSTGGAFTDYARQKAIVNSFSNNFFESLLNYDKFSTRHSPVLIIFLAILEKLSFSDLIIRFIHLHLCLILPFYFYKCLRFKFKFIDKKILFILTGLIFFSPTFRSLSIWPDSRILGLTLFTIGIFYFLKFEREKKINFAIKNVFLVALSAYISPNFSIFSLFFFLKYTLYYNFFSKPTLLIIITNLILSIPAIYYVFILEINFFLKSAVAEINWDEKENIIFNNIFNDFIITFSFLFFYIFPFLFLKIINLEKIITFSNLIYSSTIFLVCAYFFDYNYLYGGGGIIFKISNFLFNNNYFFYLYSYLSIIICLPLLYKNKFNILIFLIIILNNPQYTLYHKYFDPFLVITFFTIFYFNINLNKIILKNNYFFIYIYFVLFLIINNLKSLWIT